MRVAVMGAGGVGGYFGAVLARAGHQVHLIARGAHLEAIRSHGLRVESTRSGHFTVHPPATDDPSQVGPVDLVLFTVKAYHNGQAIPAIAPLVGPDTAVLTLQNGVDSGEQLARLYGWERVLPGATYIEAAVKGPGVVVQQGEPCRIVFGAKAGPALPRARRVHQALTGAGVEASLVEDIDRELWGKFVYICGLSGVLSVTRATLVEVLSVPPARSLLLQVMQEVQEVGQALGVSLTPDTAQRAFDLLERHQETTSSSMQRDLLLGRRLEVEALHGTVVRLARQAGVEAPANGVIYACLKLADELARRRLEGA